MTKVKPELPGGFHDNGPKEMILKRWILEKMIRIYELYGYNPIETSIVQKRDVLFGDTQGMGGSEHWTVRRSNAVVSADATHALAFDQTVPASRFIAANLDMLPRPFRRWQLGWAHRAEKPQAGRFCGFTQLDFDIFFVNSIKADAEVLAIMIDLLNALELPGFTIHVNDRRLSDLLPDLAGFDQSQLWPVMRVIDKISKIGLENVIAQLAGKSIIIGDQEVQSDVQIPSSSVDVIERLINITGSNNHVFAELRRLFASIDLANQIIDEDEQMLRLAGIMQTSGNLDNVKFNPSVVRGLSYYTGPVFEAELTGMIGERDLALFGSIVAGGRFDELLNRFVDANVAGVGASIGVDRLLVPMQLIRKHLKQTTAQVLITILDPSRTEEYFKIAAGIRAAGVNTVVYMGEEMSFKAQMAFATKQEIPLVVIAGDELDTGEVSLKYMNREHPQERIKIVDLPGHIANYLT
ncbi:histidine--tRNA ligase family protein [Candidatus Falkowbacteria bacterium]|nr:histidine--tRNA ligase family protein [Candidatus Falkowbacteria bacterium]